MKHNYDFWNNKLPKGFYDDIFRQGKSNNASLQSSWHNLTFLKIKDYVDESETGIRQSVRENDSYELCG